MTAISLDPRVEAFLAAGQTRLLINGAWVDAADGATFQTLNPATDEPLMRCASAAEQDVDRAVDAATAAAEDSWKKITPSERGRLLWRVAELLERDADALAQLEVLDMGKPLRLARDDDLPMAIDHFRYFAGWATKLEGETIPVSAGAYLNYTVREPLGVVGLIIPWNYPLMLAAWKLAPALACGNTCLLKPAEQTPLTAVWLGQLLLEAGIPPGVVNILTGFGETAGAAIAQHPGVAGVAFTGSTAVGREIVRASAGNLKRTALELGGKSPNVVFADAEIDAAVAGAAHAIFYNMGQDCAAARDCSCNRKFTRTSWQASLRRPPRSGLAPGWRKGSTKAPWSPVSSSSGLPATCAPGWTRARLPPSAPDIPRTRDSAEVTTSSQPFSVTPRTR